MKEVSDLKFIIVGTLIFAIGNIFFLIGLYSKRKKKDEGVFHKRN